MVAPLRRKARVHARAGSRIASTLLCRVASLLLGLTLLGGGDLLGQDRPPIVTTPSYPEFLSASRLAYQASTHTLYWTSGAYFGRVSAEPGSLLVQLSPNSLPNQTTGLVTMVDGRVFVADSQKVYQLNFYGTTTVVAGGGSVFGDRDAMGTTLWLSPGDLAGDAAGNLYIADTSNRLIRVMNRDGFVSTLAGRTNDSSGLDGPRAVASFASLREIEVTPSGDVWVIDGNRLRRVAPDGSVSTVAGSSASSAVIDGVGAAARFYDPRYLTVDSAGNAYVLDLRRLRRITPAGEVTTLLGADLPVERIDGVGSVVRFRDPGALTLGPGGRLVVVDESRMRWIALEGVPAPAAIEFPPVAATGLLGGSHTFSVVAWGTPTPVYQWFKNGQAIVGATGPTLTLSNLTPADAALYRVSASNENGSATSADVALHVQAVSPNDSFSGALALNSAPVTVSADYIGATREAGEPAHNGSASGGSLWWNFTAPSTGFVRAEVAASTTPSVVQVYTGNSVDALTPVPALSAYASLDNPTRVTFAVTAGAVYRLAVERVGASAPGAAHLSLAYAQVAALYAGSPTESGSTNATNPLDARFTSAGPLARDAAGNLYVGDGTTIRRITPAGVVANFVTGVQALGLVFDSTGNLIVADPVRHVIRRITPAGAVSILAGAENTSGHVDATGGAARFSWPYDVAIDAANNLYVADQSNHVIRRITPAGAVTTIVGTPGQFGSADGNGAAAQLYLPRSLVVVGTKLYFIDNTLSQQSNRLRVVDLPTLAVTTLAEGSDVIGRNGTSLRADAVGNLYFASRYAIRRISPNGRIALHVGNGNQTGGLSAGDPLAVAAGEPQGVLVDPAGNLFYTSSRSVYRAAATSGNVAPVITAAPAARTVGEGAAATFSVTAYGGPTVTYQWRKNGSPLAGQTAPALTFPSAALTDAGNYSVTVTAGGTATTTTEVAFGVQPVAANDAFANAAVLRGAAAAATGQNYGATRESGEPVLPGAAAAGRSVWWAWIAPSDGTIVVQTIGAEMKNTLAVYSGGTLGALQLLAQDDNAADNFTRVSVPVTAGTMYRFVVDGLADFAPSEGALRLALHYGYTVVTVGGQVGSSGQLDAPTLAAARFGYVNAMARDAAGNVYLWDAGLIRKITPTGEVSSIAGAAMQTSTSVDGTGSVARIPQVVGMAVAADGNLYFADAYTVRRMTPAGVVTTLAGAWNTSGSTDGTGTAARFSGVSALVAAPNGSLYLADQSGRVIRRLVLSTLAVTTAAGSTTSGQLDGVGTAARFSRIEDLALGADGQVLVADTNGNTLRRLNLADNAVTTVLGGAGKPARDGPAAEVALSQPYRIATDAAGNVFLYERGWRALRRWGTDGQVATLAGDTESQIVMRDGAGLAARFTQNGDMVLNADGSLLISSASETVIRRAEPSTMPRAVAIVAVSPGRFAAAGTRVEVFANVVGNPTPTLAWKRDGQVVPGAVGERLVFDAAQPGDSGRYTLEATQGGTTVVSAPIALRVYGAAANDNFAARESLATLPVARTTHNYTASPEPGEPAHLENNTGSSVWFTWTAPTDGTVIASLAGSSFNPALAIYTGDTLTGLQRLAGATGSIAEPPTVTLAITAGTTYQIAVAGRNNQTGEIQLGLRYALAPQALAENPSAQRVIAGEDGALYFTDPAQRVVRKRTAAGAYSIVAGIEGSAGAVDGPAGQGMLQNPTALTRAGDGTLYVVDGAAIRRIGTDGAITTLAGSTSQFGYADAVGAAARFSSLSGLALNADETALIIVDAGNVLLRQLALATNAVTTLVGTQNSRSAPPADGVGSAARLLGPGDIVRAPDGMLFFTESGSIGSFGSGSAVRSLSPTGDVRTVHYYGANRGYSTISIDPDGNLIVVAGDGVRQFRRDGSQIFLSPSIGNNVILTGGMSGWAVVQSRLQRIVPADFALPTVTPAPGLQAQPVSVTVFPGQSAYFNVQATGTGLTYRWQRDQVDLPGTDSATLRLSAVSAADVGAYRVIVSNAGGTVTSGEATLTLGTPPANDHFAQAPLLTGGFAAGTSSTAGATREAGEPSHAGNGSGTSVWWTWTAPASGAVIVDTSGSAVDTAVAVYTGDAPATLTEVASGQQTPLGSLNWRRARAMFVAVEGTTYRIAVDSVGGFPGAVAVHVAFAYSFSTIAGLAENAGSADGTGSAARFRGLNGSAVGPDGTIYVADLNNHTIRKVTPAGVVTTLAGLAGAEGYVNGTGSAARFNLPAGIVYWNGFLYVADANNHAIRRVDPTTGATTTFAGTNAAGTANGTGGAARFNQPAAIAVDAQGNLHVGEAGNHAVRKISPSAVVTTLAGLPGTSGAVDGTGTAARFNAVEGVAVAADGTVYAADYGNRTIRKITPAGVVTTVAGVAGSPGYIDGPAATALFSQPNGVLALADGSVLIADRGANAIRQLTPDNFVLTVAGGAPTRAADGVGLEVGFYFPATIATDGQGRIYVTDQGNHTLRVGVLSSTPQAPQRGLQPRGVRVIAGTTVTLTGSAVANPAPSYQWQRNGVDVPGATSPTLTLTDAQPAQSGSYTLVATNSLGSLTGDAAVVEILPLPANDSFASRARILGAQVSLSAYNYSATAQPGEPAHAGASASRSTWFTWTAPANGDVTIDTLGSTFDTRLAVYRGDALAALQLVAEHAGEPGRKFSRVRFVANAGDVFQIAIDGVGDATGDLRLAINYSWNWALYTGTPNGSGAANGSLAQATYNGITAIATDASGNVYVAEAGNHVIRRITPQGQVSVFAGAAGVAGSADGVGANARFNQPFGLAADRSGNLYVADTDNHTIRKIVIATATVSTIAGAAGQYGYVDATGTAARFATPAGVAVNAAGELFVSDYSNKLIRRITLATGAVTTFAGGLNTSGNSARYYSAPWGLAIDSAGNLFVADNANIRKVLPDGTGVEFAGDINGVTGFSDGAGGIARFNRPTQLAIDAQDNLYVTDLNNNVVRQISPRGEVRTIGGEPSRNAHNVGTAEAAAFGNPRAIAIDAGGFLYVGTMMSLIDIGQRQAGPGAPRIVTQPEPQSVASGGTVSFTVVASGQPAPTYQWRRNGTPLEGATSPVLTLTNVTQIGSYDVVVTNANGSITSRAAGLTLASAPTNDAFAHALALTGNSVTASAFPTAATAEAGEPAHAGAPAARSLWWSWMAPAGGVVVVQTAGSAVDTRLAVYTGGNVGALELVAANDDALAGGASRVQFLATPGTTYFIAVDTNPTAGAPLGSVRLGVDYAYVVSTFAGSPGQAGAANGQGSAARFTNPSSIARDSAGNLYVAEPAQHVIRKIAPDGTVSVFAGAPGQSGATNANGAAARFNLPYGLAVDAANHVFVADYGNRVIRRITPAGDVTTFAGAVGQGGATDGAAANARFNLIFGLAFDASGALYATDLGNHNVRKISAGTVTTLAGSTTGVAGALDGTTTAARFNQPRGLTVDAQGNVYVADFGNHTVRQITPAGVVTTLAGFAGSQGVTDGLGSNARFTGPCAVAFAAPDRLFVTDVSHRVRAVSTVDGLATTAAGSTEGAAEGIALAARFDVPIAIVATPDGVLYAADHDNHTLRALTPSTQVAVAQSIGFAPLLDRAYTPLPITLSATTTSGLPVVFELVAGDASLDGNQLTLLGTGTITIRATQPGDATHLAAEPVTRSFTVTPNFLSWQLDRFTPEQIENPALTGPNADFDRDGFSNLVEYALGLDPRVASHADAPTVAASASEWTFTYTRPADRSDVTYTVQTSTNLTTWTDVAATRTANGPTETWRATVPVTGNPNLVFRLKVQR